MQRWGRGELPPGHPASRAAGSQAHPWFPSGPKLWMSLGDSQVPRAVFASSLERALEHRKSISVVLTPMSSAVHQPWRAAAKASLPPRGFPCRSLPRRAKCSTFRRSRPSPLPLLPSAGTECSSFLPAPGDRGSRFCPPQPVQAEAWVGCRLPACPLPSVTPSPPSASTWAIFSPTFPLLLPGSPPGFHTLTRQEQAMVARVGRGVSFETRG